MGISLSAVKKFSSPDVVEALIILNSDSALNSPATTLVNNLGTALQQLGIQPNAFILDEMSLIRATAPSNQIPSFFFSYSFTVRFNRSGSQSLGRFQGPVGPAGPPGQPGQQGAQGIQGSAGPTGPGGGGGGGTGAGLPDIDTAHNRDILKIFRTIDPFHVPNDSAFDGTSVWFTKSNFQSQFGPGPGAANGPGIIRVDPIQNRVIETIDTGDAGDIISAIVWTGTKLIVFGVTNPFFFNFLFAQEIFPGSPTTFGPKQVFSIGTATFIGDALWDGSKIWVTSELEGILFRFDQASLGAPEVAMVVDLGNTIQGIAIDPDTSHYADSKPKLFVTGGVSNGFVYRINNIDTIPIVDASATAGTGAVFGVTVGGGFLYTANNISVSRFILDPFAFDFSNFGFGTAEFLDIIFDPSQTKLFVVLVNIASVDLFFPIILRLDLGLTPEVQAEANPDKHFDSSPLPIWRLNIFNGKLWFPDPSYDGSPDSIVGGGGDLFSLSTGFLNGAFADIVKVPLELEYQKTVVDIQHIAFIDAISEVFWDRLSDIISVEIPPPLIVRLSTVIEGKQITIIDTAGGASTLNPINIFSFSGPFGAPLSIQTPFASITVVGVGGIWRIINSTDGLQVAQFLVDTAHVLGGVPTIVGDFYVWNGFGFSIINLNQVANFAMTGDLDDFDPGACIAFSLTLSAPFNLTGLVPPAPEFFVTKKILNKNSANTLTIKHLDGASSAPNQFIGFAGVDKVLGPNESTEALYDFVDQKWRVLY
jgi:hypothetical protein